MEEVLPKSTVIFSKRNDEKRANDFKIKGKNKRRTIFPRNRTVDLSYLEESCSNKIKSDR